MDRKFALTGLGYAIIGLALGIHMAMSQDHGQKVTHAHIMLVGFVVTFVYALCHKLWLNNNTSKLAMAQFYIHQLGAVVLLVGLFLFYGGFVGLSTMDPILGAASIAVFIGMILMKVLFIRETKKA